MRYMDESASIGRTYMATMTAGIQSSIRMAIDVPERGRPETTMIAAPRRRRPNIDVYDNSQAAMGRRR